MEHLEQGGRKVLAGIETGIELGAHLAVEQEDVPANTYSANIGDVVEQEDIERLFDGAPGAAITPTARSLKKKSEAMTRHPRAPNTGV
jgi:hypothetical protein